MKARITLEARAERFVIGWQAEIRADTPNMRMARLGVFYGPPAGSRKGFWRTRINGVHGVNYRVQVRPPSPEPRGWRCLTILAHIRPQPALAATFGWSRSTGRTHS